MKKFLFTLVFLLISILGFSQDLSQVDFDKVVNKSFATEMYKHYMNIWDMSVNAKSHEDVVKSFSEIGFLEWNTIKLGTNGCLMFFQPAPGPEILKKNYLPIQNKFIAIDVSTEDHGLIHPLVSITIDNEGGKAYYAMMNVFISFDFHMIGKLKTYNVEDGYTVVEFKNGLMMSIRTYDLKRFIVLDISHQY